MHRSGWDLFAAMRAGKASIVNGEIETFTEMGLRLTSGQEIEADVIVTATGLKLRLVGASPSRSMARRSISRARPPTRA